jgi:hypothetical protein
MPQIPANEVLRLRLALSKLEIEAAEKERTMYVPWKIWVHYYRLRDTGSLGRWCGQLRGEALHSDASSQDSRETTQRQYE